MKLPLKFKSSSAGEAGFQYALIAYLRSMGALVRRLSWLGVSGAPDLFVAIDGRILLIECKALRGKLSALQSLEIKRLRQQGVPCFVLSEGCNIPEEVRRVIEELEHNDNF